MFSFATRRAIHTVPKLTKLATLEKAGIPNVLSANGFKQCWSEQQKYLCDKLTLATAGTAMESYLPFHLILNTAKRPFHTHIFNLASACHNNHLFIENILPNESSTSPSSALLHRIEQQYGYGWEELKEELIRRAEQDVLGQGWLFLVENSDKEIHILTVQNHGTPYYFPRNQVFDFNSALTAEEFKQWKTIQELVAKGNVEDWTMPLISVNLWDQAYLKDYGIKGRSAYVRNVLDNLNWSVINNRLYTAS